MPATRVRKRPANPRTLGQVLKAIGGQHGKGTSFNEVLGRLKSKGVLANHRSLRAYLDLLVASGAVTVARVPGGSPNIRPKQVYSATGEGPWVKVGEGALAFHGLGWDTGSDELKDLRVDLEGVARGTLRSGVLYGSLEDAVVEALGGAKGAEEESVAASYSAALLAGARPDVDYLLRRAAARGARETAGELLSEVDALFRSPRLQVQDIRTLYAIRDVQTPLPREFRRVPARWSLFSPDELLDVVGKQLGVK